MKDKDLTEALKNIEDSIFPQIEKIVEQSGYVKKTKYENLKRIIDSLEKRISDLEKN